MSAYSFLDVQASIVGPGGSITIGSESGAADEGITVEATERSSMQTGASGDVVHSLHGAKPGKMTLRLLKTSPINSQLSVMAGLQLASSALHGQNIISVVNPTSGDVVTGRQCAFKKLPNLTYGKEAGTNEWEFDVGMLDEILGTGQPIA